MSRFKKNKTREVPAISTASLPDIVFILLFFFMIVTEPPEKQTQLEVEEPDFEFKIDMDKTDRQNAYRVYIGYKEGSQSIYTEFPAAKKSSGNDDWRFVDVDAVMTERKAGKRGANDALNVAVKKFGDNIIAERGAGSELADYDIILTVAGTVKWEVVEEIQRDLSKQGFRNVFHRDKEDEK